MELFTVKIIHELKEFLSLKTLTFVFWLHCSTSDEFKVSFIRDTKVLYCLLRITFLLCIFYILSFMKYFPFSME